MSLPSSLLHTDFCPSLNRYVLWVKTPLGLLIMGVLASLLLALSQFKNGWWLLAFFLVISTLQIVGPMIQVAGCKAMVSFSKARISEEEEVELVLALTNRLPIPLLGLCIDKSFIEENETSRDSDESIFVSLSRVSGRQTNVCRWTIRPDHRGKYPIEKPRISSAFPFGLWTFSKEIPCSSNLIVQPKTTKLSGYRTRESLLESYGEYQDKPGEQGDVLGVRTWNDGESLRLVHWPLSAKSQEDLLVLERQKPSPQSVWVGIQAADKVKNPEIEKWQVRIYSSIVQHFQSLHFKVHLIDGGRCDALGTHAFSLQKWMDKVATKKFSESFDKDLFPKNSAQNRWIILSEQNIDQSEDLDSGNRVLVIDGSEQQSSLFSSADITIDISKKDPFSQLREQWKECCHAIS